MIFSVGLWYHKYSRNEGVIMAYRLQVKLPSGNYKSIDIAMSSRVDLSDIFKEYNNHKKCTNINKFTLSYLIKYNLIKYSLRMIDNFTTKFNNEYDLKSHLVKEGLLDYNLLDAPLVIRFYGDKKEKRVFKCLFMEDYYYLYNIDNLVSLINDRYSNKDFRFLKAYAECFCNSKDPKLKSAAGELYRYAEESLRLGIVSKGFYELDSNKINVIQRLTNMLIYKKSKDGINNELNFRLLHILIEFIKEYEAREEQERKLYSSPPKTKAKTKLGNDNNSQLEGQYSF